MNVRERESSNRRISRTDMHISTRTQALRSDEQALPVYFPPLIQLMAHA